MYTPDSEEVGLVGRDQAERESAKGSKERSEGEELEKELVTNGQGRSETV